MPYTLSETFHLMDPYVQLNDGSTVATVAHRKLLIDHTELTEYSLEVDSAGRFLIYRLDIRGFRIHPPAFIEQKPVVPVSKKSMAAGQSTVGFSYPA
jgi:hypothetical protein